MKILILILILIFSYSCGAENMRRKNDDRKEGEKKEERIIWDSFLKDKEGDWICYKYQENQLENQFSESYAREFLKYAYFNINNNILCATEIYNTPIYSYKYPVKFKKYGDESLFISSFKLNADSVSFIAPINSYEYYWENSDSLPYYRDAPINNTLLFWNNDFIVNDRGYFFFFKKEKRKRNHHIRGMPGDDRNYFRVAKKYNNISPDKFLSLLKDDFPFGFEQIMNEFNKYIFLTHDWEKNKLIILEKTQSNGKFVMKITAEDNNINLLYYLADDSDNEIFD